MLFNQIPEGYKGRLYADISPRTFGVVVRPGSKLLQMRVRIGSPRTTDTGIRRLHQEAPLLDTDDVNVNGGVAISVNLKGDPSSGLVGYKARSHTPLIDIDQVGKYEVQDFWEPIRANSEHTLILDPNASYILVSEESIAIPPDHAAEMVPFNPAQGEFRIHYAGFFDPGFGHASGGGHGARAVFEVQSFEVPFLLEHGQIVARLIYERLMSAPDRLYGPDIGSSYQNQGLALSKHFRRSP